MSPYIDMVSAILGGAGEIRKHKSYLPQFPDEPNKRYEARRNASKFTNVFTDIVGNLAQRPFSQMVEVQDAPDQVGAFSADVDGSGGTIHGFAGEVFYNAIAFGREWILVDFTADTPAGATIAQERAAGVRPSWVRIPETAMLAVYCDEIEGREQVVHARYLEPETEREGWKEVTKDRVRVLTRDKVEGEDGSTYGPPYWELWEKQEGAQQKTEWVIIKDGPISIGEIPLVEVCTGRRIGTSMQVIPPMRDAADLQIDLYQQESALKYAKEMTAFPMLVGNGVAPPIGEDGKPEVVPVGPHAVLYAPSNGEYHGGEWKFIEPSAESLKFLASDIKETILQLRELGRQPLTAQSGNLTVVTTTFAAQKGNAAIQAWALNLKDALERALTFTARWLRIEGYEPAVMINTDFDLGYGDEKTFEFILQLYEREMISRTAVVHEGKRRGVLDVDYDPDDDLDEMTREIEGSDDAEAQDAPGLDSL